MGRKLMRVSLNFDWPLRKTWKGYLSPNRSDPPYGEGYQLWETTTEGAPVSPVFRTLEELADWLAKHGSVFGTFNITKEEWMESLEDQL